MVYPPFASPSPSIIDFFCGAGGSALGFKQAGFSIALGIDNNPACTENFAKNLHAKALTEDLFKMEPEGILDAANLSSGDISVCLGCPPCQGFSSLNGKEGRDRRNSLVHRFTAVVEEIDPLFIVFENVPGIMEREWYFQGTLRRMKKAGYAVATELVDMRDHGVPQRRKRLVIVGCRDPTIMTHFSFPAPSHFKKPAKGRVHWRTVRDAIKRLPPLAAGWSSQIPNHIAGIHTPEIMEKIRAVPKDGGSRRQIPKRLWYRCHKTREGFNDVLGRMAWDEPSPTITGGCCNVTKGRFIHPSANRAITPREAARLQSFPDDYVFQGSKEQICNQIGNAFPPLYAEKLARNILTAIGDREI